MSSDLALRSIDELAPLIRDKQVSPVEITESVLKRVEKYDSRVNSHIQVFAEKAAIAAKQAETQIMNGQYLGPLHGIPMALKDIFYIKGEIATIGSKIHKNFVPDYDSTIVARLKDAGVVLTGTLNMHEYAFGVTNYNPHFGSCSNPWNLDMISGGSSGGSGAAVAADLTIASMGTDTGGSIRIPAALCGIVGLKPTHGRISKYGVFPLSWSLDHAGPMTKTVKDAAIMLEALAGFDPNDPTTVDVPVVPYSKYLTGDIKGLRIGIQEDFYFHNIEPEMEKTVRQAIETLRSLGAIVKTVKIPNIEHSKYAHIMTYFGDSGAIHRDNFKKRPQEFGDDVRFSLALGENPSAVDYVQAQQMRRKIVQGFAEAFQSVDVLISPATALAATPIGQETTVLNGKDEVVFEQLLRLTSPSNITGLPSVTVPCGFVNGLPAGLQITGRAFREDTILGAAYAFEQAASLSKLKPNLD